MRIVLLLKMSRPVSWVFAPLVFLVGFACFGAVLTPVSLFQLVLLSIPYCIFLYGINDIYDFVQKFIVVVTIYEIAYKIAAYAQPVNMQNVYWQCSIV